jgi:hypothetical protein
MRLPQLAGCVIIGILPLLWLPVLPGRWVIWGLMAWRYSLRNVDADLRNTRH